MQHYNRRDGLTLVEFLLVMVTLMVLASVLLPYISNARTENWRTGCLNKTRNLAVAHLCYASSNKSRLVAQAYYPIDTSSLSNADQRFEGRSWVVELMPYLDSNDIYDRWDFSLPWNAAENLRLTQVQMSMLTCPQDETALANNGGLSYVVNAGVGDNDWQTVTGAGSNADTFTGHHFLEEPFDWNGDGKLPPEDQMDAVVTRDLGLFWPHIETRAQRADLSEFRSHRFDEIYNGSANTIMLGENTNAGQSPTAKQISWADPRLPANGFLLPVNPAPIGSQTMAVDGSVVPAVTETAVSPWINGAGTGREGGSPFLRSNHPGVVVIAFCDGSCRTISEPILWRFCEAATIPACFCWTGA